MLALAHGPERRATHYSGYNMSGFRFHTLHHDENKKTQNNGVMVKGENQIDDVPWYVTLTEIVDLCYTQKKRVVLFNCNWYDTTQRGGGYKIDRYGITSVNTTCKLHIKDPFVLASQATQVFYVKEIKNKTWSVVVETKARSVYEMPNDEGQPYQEEEAQRCIHTTTNQNEDESNDINNSGDEGGDEDEDETNHMDLE
ncbi:hypothetical protein L3X38_012148 [Prunus dulcis]|uniref:DUF4216 domain-containing protein n=1 Tax=Prunus dulcis TaxID=3755 RepID=A0AAD4ZG40_PRUDU|nr:hypothetical protein L3X38_012148 [Prunus dulcis]